MGLIILFFVLYIAFGRYGNVTLERRLIDQNSITLVGHLCSCRYWIGYFILGVIEWAFYYQIPPNGAKAMSDEALTYATQYGMFHWGPIAWAIYVLPALPIGYLVFVKKQPIYKISQACRPVLKGQTDKFLGKLVDILFILVY